MTTSLPIIIGIAGGAASGKSSLAHEIIELFDEDVARKLPQVWFHKSPWATDDVDNDFDPNSFDFDQLGDVLESFRRGERTVFIPNVLGTIRVSPVIILCGPHAFYDQRIAAMMDIKVFVECDPDTALTRYIRRNSPGEDLETILKTYEKHLKPAFEKWIIQQRQAADIIVPTSSSPCAASLKVINILYECILFKLLQLRACDS